MGNKNEADRSKVIIIVIALVEPRLAVIGRKGKNESRTVLLPSFYYCPMTIGLNVTRSKNKVTEV